MWLEKLRDPRADVRRAALDELSSLGVFAAPVLEAARGQDPAAREIALVGLARHCRNPGWLLHEPPVSPEVLEILARDLVSGDVDRVVFSLRALGWAEGHARPLLDRLVPLLCDARVPVRFWTCWALERIVNPSPPGSIVAEGVCPPSPDDPFHALLGGIGRPVGRNVASPPAVQGDPLEDRRGLSDAVQTALVGLLDEPEAGHRALAVSMLDQQERLSDAAGLRLVSALEDRSAVVRRLAARALGNRPPLSGRTIVALIDRTSDDEPRVRESASRALKWAHPGDTRVADRLLRLRRDEDPWVRESAVEAIGHVCASGDAIGALTLSLEDESSRVRHGAARALGRIGPLAAAAAPSLARLLFDPDLELRWEAVRALARLGPSSAVAVKALEEALSSRDRTFLEEVLEALAALGPAAASTVPAIVSLLQARDLSVTGAAVETLKAIGSAAVPVMTDLLEDPTSRIDAVTVLLALREKARPAAVALARFLGDDELGRFVAHALSIIDPSLAEVLPRVASTLEDELLASLSLHLAPAGSRESVGRLVEELIRQLEKPESAPAAAWALGELGASAITAAERLESCSDRSVPRWLRAWALVRIRPGHGSSIASERDRHWPSIRPSLDVLEVRALEVGRSIVEAARKGDAAALVDGIATLIETGPASVAALPGLARATEDDDRCVSTCARVARMAILET